MGQSSALGLHDVADASRIRVQAPPYVRTAFSRSKSAPHEARWGLIRFGDYGIPTVVKLIEPGRTASDIVS